MSKFVAITSKTSALGTEQFAKTIVKIWNNLKEDAERARDLLNEDPTNDALGKSAIEKAERFLAFGELVRSGDTIIEKSIARMQEIKSQNGLSTIEIVEAFDDESDEDGPKN